jgi:hypothetical protein
MKKIQNFDFGLIEIFNLTIKKLLKMKRVFNDGFIENEYLVLSLKSHIDKVIIE